jgi:lipopolysaccharide cholinephosphotransferase
MSAEALFEPDAGYDTVMGRRNRLSVADVRTIQLNLLDTFDRFCAAHDIRYYLAYGTLLGAARHGGYIPWDDDIDLMLPRADYERFARAFGTSPPADTLRFGCAELDTTWPFRAGKLWDARTVHFADVAKNVDLGVFIDLFPVDAVPDSALASWWYIRRTSFLRRLHAASFTSSRPTWKTIVPRVVLSPTRLSRRLNRVARGAGDRRTERAGVSVVTAHWHVPVEYFGTGQDISFEGVKRPAPVRWKEILEQLYEDWQVPPPEDQRVSPHCWAAYWRAEQ